VWHSGGGRLSPAGIERDAAAGSIPVGEPIPSNDWLVRYDNRLFQVQSQNRKWPPAQREVLVSWRQDGAIQIEYRGRKLP
jgi:hypothetical protein